MVRKKQTNPEIRLFQLDTNRYLRVANIMEGVAELNAFEQCNGLNHAKALQVPTGKVLEFFYQNQHDLGDASSIKKVGTSAYETWLRKSGLLNSLDDHYALSCIGKSLLNSSLTIRSYCFLLMSKQWLVVTDLQRNKVYERNLLCVLIELFKKESKIKKDSFIKRINEKGIDLYKKKYNGLELASDEGGRFLEDPLQLGNIIEEEGGYYQLTNSFAKLADDYLNNERLLRSPSNLELEEKYECYLNELRYGVYDLINKNNKNLYLEIYPDLFFMTIQKIYFGAPGTGKSYKIKDSQKGIGLESIPDGRKFFTTFHPDYDYAQFVGAYKPKKSMPVNKTLNQNELTALLKEMKEDNNYPIHKFSALYSNSLLKLSNAEQAEIIKESGTPDSMNVELKKGIAVGEYLKEKIDCSCITYSFVPQIFAKAYAAAWSQYFNAGDVLTAEDQVFLVIEEINRGNCAQIFGDIFQLLDRDSDGFSQYAIDADCDFADWLKNNDAGLKSVWDNYKGEVGEGKLKLPPNLNILATMNTSDQSLFPMDSAFKRRFDWVYVPINYKMPKADFKVGEGDLRFDWLHFLKKVNADIRTVTESEDKQMGEFFIKPKDNAHITLEEFRSKVLFYLWDTVYKDETDKKNLFHFSYPEKGSGITFQRLFEEDEAGGLSDNSKKIIRKMLETLDDAYNSEEYKDFKIFPVTTESIEDK